MIGLDQSQVTYIGASNLADFSTVFPILAASDVKVEWSVAGAAYVTTAIGVDYSVALPNPLMDDDGNRAPATVHLIAGNLPTGTNMRISRNTPVLQPIHLRQQGSFLPPVHEESFDRTIMAVQDLERRIIALEAGTASVTLAAARVTTTFTALDPIESTFPGNVACVGIPTGVCLMRVEDLTDGTTVDYGLGEVQWAAPVLNQFTVTFLPGLTPGHQYRATFLVITT